MQFTLHQTFPDHEAWNMLLAESITNVPFLRHEYLSAWWASRGGGEWPASSGLALVTAEQEGHLAGVAPLFFAENCEGEASLLLLGSIEISDYLDLIVRRQDLAAFLPALLDFLAASPFPWKTLDCHNLLETSPSLPLLEAEARKRGWSFELTRTYHAPSIPLVSDFEAYLAGIDKKQRHEIRRKMRRASEEGVVGWYIVEQEARLDEEVNAFLEMMATEPAKAAFLTEAMRAQMRASIWAAFRAGWLQLAFLTVDGARAAVYLNFDYQNRIWVYNSGFDRRFLDYSPGWVLLGHLLQWANENKRSEFDFMRGEEDYKYRFGGVDKYVVRAKMSRK